MHNSTVYVGMDVHKETFSLCCYTNEKEQAEYPQKGMIHGGQAQSAGITNSMQSFMKSARQL